MAPYSSTVQSSLILVLLTLSLHIIYTHGSALLDTTASEPGVCPKGWYKYERFCVTRGQGSSDRAVALYCDGFGGIGIKGLCITRAHTAGVEGGDTSLNLSLGVAVGANNGETSYSTLPQESTDESILGEGALDNLGSASYGLCPQGWTHYRHLCVYKPWSVEERCHSMNAVHFNGLCIKHANTHLIGDEDVENVYREDKRICCCSNFKSPGNRYGC